MRRRDFFGKILGVLGVAAFPVISSASETVAGEDFHHEPMVICPGCGFVMMASKGNGYTSFECAINGSGILPRCPRFGIKYRAPKVRMERV